VKISKIEVQKKNKHRCSIFINGDFRFGLDKELVIKYNLNPGDEITNDLINRVLLEDEKQRIRNRAFKILNYRDRSKQELKNRLMKIGYDENLIDEVVAGFITDGTIEDRRFAREFTNDYTNLRPRGNRFITNELKKRGILSEVIDEIVRGRDEKMIIRELIKKKFCHLNLEDPKLRKKIVQRLLGYGFCADRIFEVIDEFRQGQ